MCTMAASAARLIRSYPSFHMAAADGLFYTAAMPGRRDLSFADLLNADERRRFYEAHRSIAIGMIWLVFLAPFIGLYVTGLFGAVLGGLLSVAAYFLTPYIWLKLNG